MKDGIIKLTLLGESTSGKSTIAYRMVHGVFNPIMMNTIGASFYSLKKNNVRFDLWDTAGQERYLSLARIYYRDTDIFLFVYDLSNITQTLDRVFYHLDQIHHEILYDYKIIFIGNKLDLIDKQNLQKINERIMKKLEKYPEFKANNIVEFINISAKSGENFEQFIDLINNNTLDLKEKYNNAHNNIIKLDNENKLDNKQDENYNCYC